MMLTRRLLLAAATALLCACAQGPSLQEAPPIVFLHGDSSNASNWQAVFWRFESNGWPRERLFALDVPYPQARGDDTKAQPGRSSAAENMAYLKAGVEKVLRETGAKQVVIVANSRGGLTTRNFVDNGGGSALVSHAVLGGTPNHGVWATPIDGLSDASEFAGHGPFLTALNKPKNAAGDEINGAVKWLTIRSDNNDKFAQPDGLWIGKRGVATGIDAKGPELKGATNIVIARIDHRETSLGVPAFAATYRFITGREPGTTSVTPEQKIALGGRVMGLGVSSTDPASGSSPNNLPVPGAQLEVFALDAVTGERRGAAIYSRTITADGTFGPFDAQPDTRYEFTVAAPGYATTHIYRSPFPRSTSLLRIVPRRIAEVDKNAPSIVIMERPRGYLDPSRDKMAFDGQSPPPGAVLGAGVASSTIKPTGIPRAVTAEFNGERVVGRSWPAAENHVSVLELTY